jgi:hypothetical protein
MRSTNGRAQEVNMSKQWKVVVVTVALVLSGLVAIGVVALVMAARGVSAGKQAGEATAGKYFQAVSQKDWDTVMSLYSPLFFEKLSKKQWRDTLATLAKRLGDYQSHQLKEWEYRRTSGPNGSQRVMILTYQVRYTKAEATETLTFSGGSDGELQIVGHRINSPALLASTK